MQGLLKRHRLRSRARGVAAVDPRDRGQYVPDDLGRGLLTLYRAKTQRCSSLGATDAVVTPLGGTR